MDGALSLDACSDSDLGKFVVFGDQSLALLTSPLSDDDVKGLVQECPPERLNEWRKSG